MGKMFLLSFVMMVSVAFAEGSSVAPLGQVMSSGLSVEQARQVLIVVLKHQGYKLEKAGLFIEGLVDEGESPFVPGYISFSLLHMNPKAPATENLGLFSVSVLTGDVWEFHTCKRFVFPALQRMQEHIMKQTGKALTDEKGQRRGLGCTDED